MTKDTILVVEDEEDIRHLLVFHLEREGYAILEAGDGGTGLALARAHEPALVLLDVMLPVMDGFAVCKELEHDPQTASIPVIMLTARGEEVDRVLGLELGADDYVVKPFSARELLLRIRAILRRQRSAGERPSLARGAIRLDPAGHRTRVGEREVDLTATEFRLLEDLMRNAGRVRTREQLLNGVWGYQFEGYARTVDTHVRRLRAKLGEAGDIIETVRGVGYRCQE